MCKEYESNNEEQITRKTYLLLNNSDSSTKTTKLHDGTESELINIDDFTIKEVPINDIEIGQWFVFVEPTEISNTPCVSISAEGTFIYLCVKNNKNGSIEAKTTYFDFEKKIEIIGKINNMIRSN